MAGSDLAYFSMVTVAGALTFGAMARSIGDEAATAVWISSIFSVEYSCAIRSLGSRVLNGSAASD